MISFINKTNSSLVRYIMPDYREEFTTKKQYGT